jgi:transposase
MLNLSGLAVENVKETEDECVFSVAVSEEPPDVDCCLLQKLVLNGRKEAFFTDTPLYGKRVTLRMLRQRFKCQACGKTAYGSIPHMHEDHRVTQRCYDYIVKNGGKRTWSALAGELGLDPQTVSTIWNRWADAELARVKMDTPRWLGLDEIHIKGRARAVITNIEHRALVNMLPNRELDTLHAYFTSADFDPKKVEILTIDMWNTYRILAKKTFPHAKVVVDKFHVIQLVTRAMEKVRREERARLRKARIPNNLGNRYMFLRNFDALPPGDDIIDELDIALGQHPIVKVAYDLKERFRDVWKAKTRAEAEAVYSEWAHAALDSECALVFAPVIRSVSNWKEEIFAYHDVQLTNAYTESFNAVARKMNRAGNGYSFEALKKRLLMAHGLGFRKEVKPSYCFPYPPGPPKDIRAVTRRLYPVRERPVIGFRLSTLARLAGKMPLD